MLLLETGRSTFAPDARLRLFLSLLFLLLLFAEAIVNDKGWFVQQLCTGIVGILTGVTAGGRRNRLLAL